MKRITFLVAFMLIGLSTFAQGPKGERTMRGERLSPEERKAEMLSRMTTNLDLTAKQQRNIEAILTDAHTKLEQLRGENKPAMEAMKTEMKQAREQHKGDRKQLFAAMKAIKEKHSTDIEFMRKEAHRIKAESKLDILDELTREQQIQFLMQDDKRHRSPHGKRGDKGRGPHPPHGEFDESNIGERR